MTTSVTQGVSGIVSALDLARPPEDRDQRVRVPDHRADRARAGAARRRGRARHARRGRLDPARALRRGRRRADGARLLHDRLVPHRASSRRRRDRAHRPRGGRALPRRLVPGDRRDRLRCARARRRLRHRRHGQVPARHLGPRLPLRPRRAARRRCCRARPAGSPTRTSSGWTSRTTRPPPTRAASTPGRRPCRTSTPASRACRSSRRPARPRSRSTSPASPTRLIDGLERARRGRPDAARSCPPRPARHRPLDRRPARSSTELAAEQIVCSERDSNLRIALHLYNVEEDVDRLLGALREKRSLLA